MLYARMFVSCALVFTAVGCAASSSESSAPSNDNAITGVTDLSEMEAALGLYGDTKDAHGAYERPEAKLVAGPCYAKLMKGPSAAEYELRRYTSGAAFFKKAGAGVASGDERPVLCVDVDVDDAEGDGPQTIMVSDIEIDSVLRYRLGAPTGGDGAAGTFYDDFTNGAVSYHGGYCPEKTGFDPLSPDAMKTFCFGEVKFPGDNGADGRLQLLVYQFASKNAAATNRYSMSADPVGRFVSMEGDGANQHIRFEHLDGHSSQNKDGTVTTIAITPKNSDAAIATNAIVTCTIAQTDNEIYDVKCKGI
jgi:hypothetical protein